MGTISLKKARKAFGDAVIIPGADLDIKNAVIVDVEATPARTYDEVAATQTMLDRTQERFGLKPTSARS